VDQNSPSFLLNVGGNAVVHQVFGFCISICFEDNCVQSGKVSEIAPNLACFCPPPNFFWGRLPKFWSSFYKLNMLTNVRQNFAEIGSRTSEISRWKKIKKTVVKHKAFRELLFSIFAIFYFSARAGWKCCLSSCCWQWRNETGRWNSDDVSYCRA